MDTIIIGKYALESLTTGMYSDPFVVYREYIQNAADSIDEAAKCGFIAHSAGLISISIDPRERKIVISDNGIGISPSKALETLTNIGNSLKKHNVNRGFRGIGRLSGLSYCGRLTFETSCAGENSAVRVSYDAKRLGELLTDRSGEDITAERVLLDVLTTDAFPEPESTHYFRVIMQDVSDDSGLLNDEKVLDYLSQVGPVPFDISNFHWANAIEEECEQRFKRVNSYNIRLNTPHVSTQVFKPYVDEFEVGRTSGCKDTIQQIEYATLYNRSGNVSGFVWYGVSSLFGTIADKNIKGLRVRVGNIMVGDHQTMNSLFKDPRFNGWIIGEIMIDDDELIPNARRDNFEKNAAYYHFMEQLDPIASNIVRRIRAVSSQRNKQLGAILSTVDNAEEKIEHFLRQARLERAQKGALSAKVAGARRALESVTAGDEDQLVREDALAQLDILTGRLHGITSYKAINVVPNLTAYDRKLLERIFDNLIKGYPKDEAEDCINKVLSAITTA